MINRFTIFEFNKTFILTIIIIPINIAFPKEYKLFYPFSLLT